MNRQKMKQLLALLMGGILVSLGIACSTSSSAGNGSSVVSFRLAAKAGDKINAYVLEGGTTTNPGTVFASGEYDATTSSFTLAIDTSAAYRLRLEREGVEFMETAILQNQYSKISDGKLNVGEMSGLSTCFVYSSLLDGPDEGKTVEAELLQELNEEGLAYMDELKIENASSFTYDKKDFNRYNFVIITLARTAKALASSAKPVQADVDLMVDLMVSWFDDEHHAKESFVNEHSAAINALQSQQEKGDFAREAASHTHNLDLAGLYIILANTGTKALPTLEPSEIQSLYIPHQGHTLEDFLNLVQTTSDSSKTFLNLELGGLDDNTVQVNSFGLAHQTYGTQSGDDFTLNTLAPVFKVGLAESINGTFDNFVDVVISANTNSITNSNLLDASLVRTVTDDNEDIFLMVKKSNSVTITNGSELKPGKTYNYTITPKTGKTLIFNGAETTLISGNITTRTITFTYPITNSTTDSLVDLNVGTFQGMSTTTPTFLLHSSKTIDNYTGSGPDYGIISYTSFSLTLNGSPVTALQTGNHLTVTDHSNQSAKVQVLSTAGLVTGGSYTLDISGSSVYLEGSPIQSADHPTTQTMNIE